MGLICSSWWAVHTYLSDTQPIPSPLPRRPSHLCTLLLTLSCCCSPAPSSIPPFHRKPLLSRPSCIRIPPRVHLFSVTARSPALRHLGYRRTIYLPWRALLPRPLRCSLKVGDWDDVVPSMHIHPPPLASQTPIPTTFWMSSTSPKPLPLSFPAYHPFFHPPLLRWLCRSPIQTATLRSPCSHWWDRRCRRVMSYGWDSSRTGRGSHSRNARDVRSSRAFHPPF
ncbi:hypothetical protein C8F01DRAFT_449598 [Mycena amicta]|nr:hypothetical protein C8F01DRAFT_449598 [Mycena amicta]